MPDEKLEHILHRLRSDDKGALKQVFQMCYPIVVKSIHRFIQDRNLVEDLSQEVFMRFWTKRHQINVTTSLPAYLRRMAINEALGYLRSKKNHSTDEFTLDSITETDAGAEQQYLYNELQDNITSAIDTLPPKCKIIFKMSRFDDMTYREIADALNISIKTVENQMGKALRLLRGKLKSYL